MDEKSTNSFLSFERPRSKFHRTVARHQHILYFVLENFKLLLNWSISPWGNTQYWIDCSLNVEGWFADYILNGCLWNKWNFWSCCSHRLLSYVSGTHKILNTVTKAKFLKIQKRVNMFYNIIEKLFSPIWK